MFGSLLETEDEGEYARDNSGQDFANCDLRTEVENANLRSEESGRFFLCKFSFADLILCSRISFKYNNLYVLLDFQNTISFEACALTIPNDGSQDNNIHCFKADQPCHAGMERLQSLNDIVTKVKQTDIMAKQIEKLGFERSPFVRANRGIMGCCWFIGECRGALPLLEIWSHEFVN